MKKFMAYMLCCSLAVVMFNSAFAVGSEHMEALDSATFCDSVLEQTADSLSISRVAETNIDFSSSFYLYSFDDEPIAIYYKLAPVGYAIYDYTGDTVLEYSKDANHPFYTDNTKTYYYEGVFNYYEKTTGGFRNLVTRQVKEIPAAYSFKPEDFYAPMNASIGTIETASTEGPVHLTAGTRYYNCNTDSNLHYFYPNLSDDDIDDCPGVCGSVACAILLAFLDDNRNETYDCDFVDNYDKEYGFGTEENYGKLLVADLVPLIEPNGNGSIFLNPGFMNYLSYRGINARISLGLLTPYQQTKNSIGADGSGNPVIVGTTSHYSVGIAYKNITNKQICTNTGLGYTVWIDANTIVSVWTFVFDGLL